MRLHRYEKVGPSQSCVDFSLTTTPSIYHSKVSLSKLSTPAGSSSLPWNERPKSLFKIELRNSPIAGGTHVVGARLPGLSGTNRLIVRYVIIEAVPVGRLSVRVGRRRGSRGRSGGRCKRHDLSKKIVDAEYGEREEGEAREIFQGESFE